MSDVNIQTFSGKVNVSNNFTFGGGHLFVDTQNNQVGLNTNTPEANLHVTGNTYISTDISVGGTLTMGTVTVEALHSLDAVTSVGNTHPTPSNFKIPRRLSWRVGMWRWQGTHSKWECGGGKGTHSKWECGGGHS